LNIKREWAREAPVDFSGEGVFTLDNLVSDFVRRRSDPHSPLNHNRDDVVDYCAQATSLRQAIWRAADSRRPDGRLHNHQSRVAAGARMSLGAKMIRDQPVISQCDTFEALLMRLEGYDMYGIGPVTYYDVATRVAAFLGLAPRRVHMHAGCLAGFKAWLRSPSARAHYNGATPPAGPKVGAQVNPKRLPQPFRRIAPDEVEDFLCVYREVLHRAT
jgi:hypothetical protein